MKSVRLDSELERRLELAAAIKGETLSEFIRRAAADRADQTLAADDASGFGGVVGAVRGGGGRARNTGAAFREQLRDRDA